MACEATRVWPAQRRTIDFVCSRLFEMGYVAVEVDPRFRRSEADRIAVPKREVSASTILWIRPEQRDVSISIRPYTHGCVHGDVKQAVKRWREAVPVCIHWRSRPLFFVSEKKVPWYERISPDGRETLKLLRIAF